MKEETKSLIEIILVIIVIILFFIGTDIALKNINKENRLDSIKKCLNNTNHYVENFGINESNCCYTYVFKTSSMGKYVNKTKCIGFNENEIY